MARSIPNREIRKVWKHFPLDNLFAEGRERKRPYDPRRGEYVCEHCGETFDRCQVLAGHVSAHHSSGG